MSKVVGFFGIVLMFVLFICCQTNSSKTLEASNEESGIIWKESQYSSVAGLYNSNTKSIEWKESTSKNVFGVYNQNTGLIEWNETSFDALAGLFNQETGKVSWRKSLRNDIENGKNDNDSTIGVVLTNYAAYSAVFNPILSRFEWKGTFGYYSIAGAFNFDTKKVEWKESISQSVAGIYSPILKKVIWKESFYPSVAGVFNQSL